MDEHQNKPSPQSPPAFTSELGFWRSILVLLYLPIHIAALPALLRYLMEQGVLDAVLANVVLYLIGAAFMLAVLWRFLQEEFFRFCDSARLCFSEIIMAYGIMLLCNFAVNGMLMFTGYANNPNNAEIVKLSQENFGMMAALGVFLAPLVEEPIFRAGVFGVLRRKSRIAAYAVSVLSFAGYHVWGYAQSDPMQWLYVLQYLPISFLLARAYERTNSLWTSIFLHMTVNGVSMLLLSKAGEML